MSITVMSREILLTKEFYHQMAKRLYEDGHSRNGFASVLAKVLAGKETDIVDEFGKLVIVDEDGNPDPDGVANAYGEDCSWNSMVKFYCHVYPERRPRDSLLYRLQLIDAYYQILGEPIELDWKKVDEQIEADRKNKRKAKPAKKKKQSW